MALSGDGFVPPGVLFSPTELNYSDQELGSASPPKAVVLSNPGTEPLLIAAVGVSAGYQQSNGCGPAVAGGAPQQDDLFGFGTGNPAARLRNRKRAKPAPAYQPTAPDLPVKIVQINLVAKGDRFEGNDILRAAYDTGLEAGEMQIFHRYPPGKQAGEAPVVFSMASMVEPGIFPLDDMSEFSTPGLTLFARLPGPMDGLAVFADILFTAERLASILGGNLQDETHSHLTKQTIEHMREEILEHRRRLQLLQKKK